MKKDIIAELEETEEILNSLANIFAYMDDLPAGCVSLTGLAARKISLIQKLYSFPDEEKEA